MGLVMIFQLRTDELWKQLRGSFPRTYYDVVIVMIVVARESALSERRYLHLCPALSSYLVIDSHTRLLARTGLPSLFFALNPTYRRN